MRSALSLILLLTLSLAVPARADEILVSAAASLTDAMEEIGRAFTKTNPKTTVRFQFAASGVLQRQIEQGAPVDVFLSASPQEMDALQRANHIETATRIRFASNRLALIAPPSSKIRRWEDLATPAVRRVAVSNPETVPAGRYAREILTKRKLWDAVKPKAVFGENVRQTLTYVANGDTDAGIVFATDGKIEEKRGTKRVKIVAFAVPTKDHTPIVYPAAVVKDAPNPSAARRFVTFLKSPEALGILTKYGFLKEP